ncbi:TIR domain-containing protein [Robiginitalea sp. M366]|uniref:TIR domain-containing protein n=1 Tax=Robiginitalea aestuariiviva TaxID=3036903 RepID=UPI00240DEA0C|nr:TIR domain-containing protein [Robiginitalea aestuariiviva]MDG1571545.1 TIR domain-containing protein [Robiginitalea aestuariiviva]
MKYNAFISYSHGADGRLAPALQLALEKFAKPWYKVRNLEVFRDEANLSVTPKLWSNIQEALLESEYLIYMASPRAAQSKWVQKEVAFWLEHKSLDTLIIGLTEGEVNWGHASKPDPATDPLPHNLREVISESPFYIDLRELRTQEDLTLTNAIFKKEVLKLAAQLHGKAPKDLAGEEVLAHRRLMRIRNLAIGMIALLLAGVGYAVLQAKYAEEVRRMADMNSKKSDTSRVRAQAIAANNQGKIRLLERLSDAGLAFPAALAFLDSLEQKSQQEYPFFRTDSLSWEPDPDHPGMLQFRVYTSSGRLMQEIPWPASPSE